MYELTAEQKAIVARSKARKSFAVKAFAGSGKTSTAVEIVKANPDVRFLYIAFNRKVAEEARERFPRNCTVKTAHALAFASHGKPFVDRLTTSTFQLKKALAERFERAYLAHGGDAEHLNAAFLATIDSLNEFFASDRARIALDDVAEGPYDRALIAKIARAIWRAMTDVAETIPVTHDAYLKAWQLSRPTLPAQYLIFDECQDASPAMLDVVLNSGIPTIFIGDPWQSIYAFRGAVDAFRRIGHLPTLPLSSSWRFGPEIAAQANAILSALGERTPLKGHGPASRVITAIDSNVVPDAVVARTTGGLITEAVALAGAGSTIHIVGGIDQIFAWLKATYEMIAFGRSRHADFVAFKNYDELKETAELPIGKAYAPYVRLGEQYGTGLLQVLAQLEAAHVAKAADAAVVLSSAHRFKGQEAPRVRIADDYRPFARIEPPKNKDDKEHLVVDLQEANLAYVALTRGKEVLDISRYLDVLRQSLDALASGLPIEYAQAA